MLNADLPYPSLDGIKEDLRTLRMISPAYAGREGELTAALQYVYQAIFLGATGDGETGKVLMGIAVSEMHHIEILGTVITKLGAPPVFASCPPYPVGYYSAASVNYAKDRCAMLTADICGEQAAIRGYEQMLRCIENPRVAKVIERIIEDEKVHLQALRDLLDRCLFRSRETRA